MQKTVSITDGTKSRVYIKCCPAVKHGTYRTKLQKLNGYRNSLLLTSVKISPLVLFIVREVIVNSERLKVNCIHSAEYQQLSLTVVLLLRAMALYLLHIIKHITIIVVTTTTTFFAYYYYYCHHHHHHHHLLYAGYLYLYSWDKLCP